MVWLNLLCHSTKYNQNIIPDRQITLSFFSSILNHKTAVWYSIMFCTGGKSLLTYGNKIIVITLQHCAVSNTLRDCRYSAQYI